MFANPSKRLWVHAFIFAVPTAIATSLGLSYTLRKTCGIGSKLTTALFLLLLCAYAAAFILPVQVKSRWMVQTDAAGRGTTKIKHPFIKALVIFLIAWGPYYLASFPGLYVYDAIPQTTRAISMCIVDTWHPLIHTYWMSGCMMLGKALLNSYQIGFAIYTTTQYLLFATLLAYFAHKILDATESRVAYTLCTIFFALFPIFPIMAVSSTKDTIFSASFAVFSILAFSLSKRENLKTFDKLMLFFSAFLLSCFRNNGYYALILAVVVILALKLAKQISWKKWVMLLCVCGFAAVLVPKVVSERSSNAAEVLGVPIQQVSRAAVQHESELSDIEVAELDRIIPAWRNYYPAISDPVKFTDGTSDAVSENLGAFINLWIKYLLKYPYEYIDATFGMVNCWVNPFASIATWDINHPYLEFDSYEIYDSNTLVRHWPTHDDFMSYDIASVIQVDRASLFPRFAEYMRTICYDPPWYIFYPLRVLTSTGLFAQIAFYAAVASLYKRVKTNTSVFVFTGSYYLTCLLGPAYLVRYALPFYLTTPLVLFLLIESVLKKTGPRSTINLRGQLDKAGTAIDKTIRTPIR